MPYVDLGGPYNPENQGFLSQFDEFVRPHLEYCVEAWRPNLVRDVKISEQVQRILYAGLVSRGCEELTLIFA